MKTTVYHMWVDWYDTNTQEEIPKSERKVRFEIIGNVEGENFSAEDVWHLTNWSCWSNENNIEIECDGNTYKPTKFDRGVTNDDICFFLNGEWWCAKPCGWHRAADFASAIKFLYDNARWLR